jgi:hypothetical protein
MKFKFYPDTTVQKARELKKKGVSAAEISRRLNIGDTTILRWCDDILSGNPYHLYAQKLQDKAKEKSIGLVRSIKLTGESAKILASILYWCEGSKYPSSNFVAFSNSDVSLVTTFLNLFRLGFQPKENKLKASLQLHTTHNKEKITSFWSKILQIPKSQFYKPTITKPTKNMKRRNYIGTCTIRYYDVYLLLEIMGIFEEFSKKILKIKFIFAEKSQMRQNTGLE